MSEGPEETETEIPVDRLLVSLQACLDLCARYVQKHSLPVFLGQSLFAASNFKAGPQF